MSILGQIVAVACFGIAMLSAYQLGRLNADRRLLAVLRRMDTTPSVHRSDLDGYRAALWQILNDPLLFDNGKATR